MHYVPRLVWVDHTWSSGTPAPPQFGILLDWRHAPDNRGVMQWHGLVVYPRGGGDLPWHLATEWIWVVNLFPAELLPPVRKDLLRGQKLSSG